jgi:hypothetical protein
LTRFQSWLPHQCNRWKYLLAGIVMRIKHSCWPQGAGTWHSTELQAHIWWALVTGFQISLSSKRVLRTLAFTLQELSEMYPSWASDSDFSWGQLACLLSRARSSLGCWEKLFLNLQWGWGPLDKSPCAQWHLGGSWEVTALGEHLLGVKSSSRSFTCSAVQASKPHYLYMSEHTCNPGIREAEAGGVKANMSHLRSSRQAWATLWDPVSK